MDIRSTRLLRKLHEWLDGEPVYSLMREDRDRMDMDLRTISAELGGNPNLRVGEMLLRISALKKETLFAQEYACPVPFSTVICHPERLTIPYHWKKPRVIMCPSMGDLFHDDVPQGFIHSVFSTIDDCLQHTFIILTKRPERARDVLWNWTKLPNVVLGVSCSTQAEADHAIPILLSTPANRRIVSLEPLVGPVDLREVGGVGYKRASDGVNRPLLRYDALRGREQCGPAIYEHGNKLDGVIVGGETGPGARPMHPDWVRSLRNQCEAAGVPFFFKQWGTGLKKESFPVRFYATTAGWRSLAQNGGRLLDGRTHDGLCWNVAGKGEA